MSRTLALVASWLLLGCAVTEDNLAAVEQADGGAYGNGVMPNGVVFNGVMPNGVMPNGVMPNAVQLNGVMPNGVMPNGTLVGVAGGGAPLTGAELVGSTWTGTLTDGTTVAIRIDQAMQLTGSNADLWSYRISRTVAGAQQPLCIDD